MRILPTLLVVLATLAPVLAKGDKPGGKSKSLATPQGTEASEPSLSLARSSEEPADEEESFDMSVHNQDDSSSSSGSEVSELDSPSPLAPGDGGIGSVYAGGHAPAFADTAANETSTGRTRKRVAFSPAMSSLTSLSALSSPARRSASHSPPCSKRIINPLELDNPIYRAPSPDTPERVGRRHLALNAPPQDKTFYDRPKFAKDRRSNLDIDRRIDRTFHPYFIFDSEARRKRHNDILQDVKKLLLDLELSTNTHFALYIGRPEKNPAQPEELAHVISSRTIDANPKYRALVERFLNDFVRIIATPRRAEHAALLELALRELDAYQREQLEREERLAKMAASTRASEEAHRKLQEQRAKEVTSAKPKTRSAARGNAPARAEPPASGAQAVRRVRPAAPAAPVPVAAPARSRAGARAQGPAPPSRAPAAAAPPPARAPAGPAPVRAPAAAAPARAPAVAPAARGAGDAAVVIPHAAQLPAPASPPQADLSFETIYDVSSDEVTELQISKKSKGKGKAKAAAAPASDKVLAESRTSSVVPDSEPERQYEAARLLSLRAHAEHNRARAQPGASTSRTTLEMTSTPRRGPTDPPSTPAIARSHGALSIPEHAEPNATADDVEDQLPDDVRGLLRGALPRPYWLAVEHIWRTYPPRDYLDGLSDLNARFELDMDISFIFKLMTMLSRTAPPAPL